MSRRSIPPSYALSPVPVTNPNVTTYKWWVQKLKTRLGRQYAATSSGFVLNNDRSSTFNLVVSRSMDMSGAYTDEYFDVSVNITRLEGKGCLNLKVKCWVENNNRKEFGEKMTRIHLFKARDTSCSFRFNKYGNSFELFENAHHFDTSIVFCCELTLLEGVDPPEVQYITLGQCLWTAYKGGVDSDLTIKAGGKEFKVHRIAFTLRSPVFQAMLSSTNFNEGRTGIVEMKNVELPVVEALIRWLYIGKVQTPDAVVDGLYKLADKYQIDDLKKYCASPMIRTMAVSNAVSRLIIAVLTKDTVLRDAVLAFIAGKSSSEYFALFQSEAWIDFKNEHQDLAAKVLAEFQKKIA